MKLPIFKNFSKPLNQTGVFNGIGENKLFDVVNLICNERCHTRKPRKAVMLNQTPPDQIIPCDNRLFFRFGNSLKEIIKNPDGSFSENGNNYALTDISPAPDRKLIIWEDDLYVLPDNIMVGTDVWVPFARSYSTAIAFPFINARTLYYPNGYSTSDYCDDAAYLEVGMKIRFSWAPSKIFTVKTIENKFESYEGGTVEVGIRITLDSNVPNYNSIPNNATAEYTSAKNRPILNDLMIGFNHTVSFSGHTLTVFSSGGNYYLPLSTYFKEGQDVKISGSSIAENNGYTKITGVSDTSLRFEKSFTYVREAQNKVITITPIIPDFSHFLLTENRIFGVDNSRGKFYISALNNPFLFYDSPTTQEDAWSIKINGTATGIALWKDNVICFTEDSGFRILGYHALNFGIRQLSLNGIKKGAGKSLVRVGDTLYYFSKKGIMKYSGGSDKKISREIPFNLNVDVAVTDDAFVYMLSDDRIWVYDTEIEHWWSENAENITDLFKFDGERYLATPEAIYLAECDLDIKVNWSFELPTFNSRNCKKLKPLYMLLNCMENTNSIFTVYFREYGKSNWQNCGIHTAKGEKIIKIPLPKNHCDGFKIKVLGSGDFYPDFWTVYF